MLMVMRLLALASIVAGAMGVSADVCDSDASALLQREQKVEHTMDAEGGSEPRCRLMNLKSKTDFTVDKHWKASFKCQNGRCNWFKLQKKEWNDDGFPTVALIRTDWHPQSLLDAGSLDFEGSAMRRRKTYISSRWWNPLLLNVHQDDSSNPNMGIFAWRVHDTRFDDEPKFLAGDGNSVYLLGVKKNDTIPQNAQWAVSVIGRAFSPGEAAAIALTAPLAAGAAVSGGIVAAGLGAGWVTAMGATTAGVVAGAKTLTPALTAKLASGFFVDW